MTNDSSGQPAFIGSERNMADSMEHANTTDPKNIKHDIYKIFFIYLCRVYGDDVVCNVPASRCHISFNYLVFTLFLCQR